MAARITVDIPASQHPFWMSTLGIEDKADKVKQIRFRYSMARSVRKKGIPAKDFKNAVTKYRNQCKEG